MAAEESPERGGGADGGRAKRKPGGDRSPDRSPDHADRSSPTVGTEEDPRGDRDSRAEADRLVTEQDALRSLQGESTERLDAARSQEIFAIRTLNFFAADVSVGHDFNTGVAGTGRGAPRDASGPVPVGSAHLTDYTAAYVQPPGFADALAVLERRHLVVLSAPAGTGRDTAALSLLIKVLGDTEKTEEPALFDLTADSVLTDEAWTVPGKACGYVASDAEMPAGTSPRSWRLVAAAERLDDAWLTRTSALLVEAESFLVVITGPLRGRLAAATRRTDFIVEHLGMPDPLEIVRTRVLAAVRELDPAELDGQLTKAGASSMVAERPAPRFAVRVSGAVVDALNANEDLAQALEVLRDPGEQVHEWFGYHTEPDQIAFAIATALLEESSFLTVSDAAVRLYLALSSESNPPPTLRFRCTLAASQPWIELTEPDVAPAAGPPVAATVRFRSPLLAAAVLTYAWNEFDGMRPALLAWLQRLVGDPDVEVRARAATAAGILAAGDFQHALHRYLLPWAQSRLPTLRQSAALALGVVGAVPSHTPRVWELLRTWAAEAEPDIDRALPAAAATAAGGPLGVDQPERALPVLRTLLSDGDWSLLRPVALSVLQLVENGGSQHVLRALLEWTAPEDASGIMIKGLLAYVFTVRQPASDSTLERSSGAHEGDTMTPRWPALLADAHQYRDELPELWGRALDSSKVRPLALEALREWLRVVDDNPTTFERVLDVLTGVANRGDRDLERLEYHLDRWVNDEDDPSPAAAHILDALLDAVCGTD
ncbi:MAG: hypothetical protein ACRDR6_01200 [Pseudonocardiaceae bacterium]